MDCINARLNYYCTAYSMAFSPCGKYLAVADGYGRITILCISLALAPEFRIDEDNYHTFQFQASSEGLCAVCSTSRHLLCSGIDSRIFGYLWSDLIRKVSTPSFLLDFATSSFRQLSGSGDHNDDVEVNCLTLFESQDQEYLFAATGKDVVEWDLDSGKVKNVYKGHSEYINCLSVYVDGTTPFLASGSEDGKVNLFDTRTAGLVQYLEPWRSERCMRPKQGNWIGALGSNENWLVCGGGPELSLWSWKARAPAAVFPSNDTRHYSVMFWEDKIISAGSKQDIWHWTYCGECLNRVPTSSSFVYDLKINTCSKPHEVLVACGSSNIVDVYINHGYKSFSLQL